MIAPSWCWLLGLGLISRILVVGFGLLAVRYLPQETPPVGPPPIEECYPNVEQAELLKQGSRIWIEPWYRWDANWFAEVVRVGYIYAPDLKCTAAFMPFLPVCMIGAERLGLDPYWIGLLLPNLAFVFGLGFFGKWVFDVTQDADLTRRACWLVVVFPFSLFFSAPYNEAFGFLFCNLALWAWHRDRVGLTALALALAGAARLTSLAVGLGLALQWLVLPRAERKSFWKVLVIGLGNITGVLLFCFYLQHVTGEFFAHPKSHVGWGRSSPSFQGFVTILESLQYRNNLVGVEALCAWSFLILGIRAWIKRGFLCGFLILFPVLQALSTGTLMSMHRVVVACFPAFIELADCLKSRFLFRCSLVAGIVLQLLYVNRYVHWIFAG